MQGTSTGPEAPAVDASRAALEFVHHLLSSAQADQPDLGGLLAGLAAAFAAPAAGLATLPEGKPLALHPVSDELPLTEMHKPSRHDLDLLDRVRHAGTALTVPLPSGGSRLLTAIGAPERSGWLLWLEDAGRAEWTTGEAGALLLAGQVLTRRLTTGETLARWAEQLDRAARQQRLEAAANLVRRLAHDFGNVLTGILGFSELALGQQSSSGTPLHAYLTEIYRGAQNGAQFTNQLRLFARRQTSNQRSCNLASVLAEEEARMRSSLGTDVQLSMELPADLPAAALDADHLRQALAVVLDNAREAIDGRGVITVAAHALHLSAADSATLFGDVRPGVHLEITVVDSGSGLTQEARRHLFTEPFFSTKPRKRGFGLAIAYGIISAHRGGLVLVPRLEGGTLARIVIPAAVAPASAAPRPQTPAQPALPQSDKVLVVDDDPMILQFVTRTLERAGYRVQAAANAEEAMRSYTGAADDPFRLVLSDVLMPHVNGVDLAKRLLALDANVRVLFMSGQVPAEYTQQTCAPGQFDLLPKPFRPEGLVRAVRAALDRVAPRRADVTQDR